MKRQTMHQVVPALIMAGAAAVPIATTVEILTHVTAGNSTIALQPPAPVALAPSKTVSGSARGAAPASSRGAKSFQGPVVNDPFGGVQATITVSGQKITAVSITAPQDNPQSASINQQAVPLLQQETLQAQSGQINTVSGATLTSQAYAQSLQAALNQARNQGNAVTAPAASAGAASSTTTQMPSVSAQGDD